MPFCFELQTDACGTPVRNIVNVAFVHLIIHGVFVTSFVFSNTCYPPYYYVDYLFGLSGGVLIGVSIFAIIIASLRNYQPIRCIWAFIVVLNILTVSVGSFYYAIARWNDVITTAFTRFLRKPIERDFPDYLWFTLVVISCIMVIPFLFYIVYISSYMCNKWKSFLFRYNYDPDQNSFYSNYYNQGIGVSQVPRSDAYPIQKGGQ